MRLVHTAKISCRKADRSWGVMGRGGVVFEHGGQQLGADIAPVVNDVPVDKFLACAGIGTPPMVTCIWSKNRLPSP